MIRSPVHIIRAARQRGSTLLIALLILVVLTLLGISTMDGSIMEETLVRNYRDEQLAFQAAEAALRDAETWIQDQSARPVTQRGGGAVVWEKQHFSTYTGMGDPWWQANGRAYGVDSGAGAMATDEISAAPRYIIEEMALPAGRDARDNLVISNEYGPTPGREFYRITTRGVGANAATQTIVQSAYVKRFN